jgi:hypothetical protein
MPGVNGDLAAITVYTNTTPVHFTTSNVPLEELRDNQLLLDQKLEGWIESGEEAFSEAGDGSYVAAVVFATTMNNTPIIATGMADLTTASADDLSVHVTDRTTSGFNLRVVAAGTGGAWTANIQWFADGR